MAVESKPVESGIDLLKNTIGQPMQPNRFLVEFTRLPGDLNKGGVPNDNLQILCKSATLPGKSLSTTTSYRHYQFPDGSVDYGDSVNFTYLCDQNFLDRAIIEEWLRMVHTTKNVTSSRTFLGETGLAGNQEGQVFSFYDDYIGQCMISSLRKDGTKAMIYTLHDCYVTGIDDISLDTETEGVLEFSFDLAYRYWTSDYGTASNPINLEQPMDGNFSVSGINKGRKIFDAVLQGLKVAGRFNKKLGDLGRRLGSYDTAITRAGNIGRDLGINSEFITQKRRGD